MLMMAAVSDTYLQSLTERCRTIWVYIFFVLTRASHDVWGPDGMRGDMTKQTVRARPP